MDRINIKSDVKDYVDLLVSDKFYTIKVKRNYITSITTTRHKDNTFDVVIKGKGEQDDNNA